MAQRLSSGFQTLQDTACSISERYPSIAFLGFAFWLAWQRVVCPVMWRPEAMWAPLVADQLYVVCAHATIPGTVAATLALCAALEGRAGAFFSSTRSAVAGGLLACVGSTGMLVSLACAAPFEAFAVLALVASVGMGLLMVRCILLFGLLAPTKVLLVVSMSWAFSFTVDILFRGMPLCVTAPTFCLIPAVCCVLLLLGDVRGPQSHDHRARPNPPRSFWQFVFTVFLVSFVAETVVYFNSSNETGQLALMYYADIAVLFLSTALLVYAVALPRSYNYGKLYYPTVFVVMILLGILFVFPRGEARALVTAHVAYQLFGLLVWCLFSCVAHQTKASPLKVFGFGYALQLAGGFLGYVAGGQLSRAFDLSATNVLTVYLVIAMLVLALSLAVYPPRAMDDLLLTIPDEDSADPVAPTRADLWTLTCEQLARDAALTARENQVLVLLTHGRGSVFISESLGIAISTVYTHTRNIYSKVGVHSREELMALVDAQASKKAGGPQDRQP